MFVMVVLAAGHFVARRIVHSAPALVDGAEGPLEARLQAGDVCRVWPINEHALARVRSRRCSEVAGMAVLVLGDSTQASDADGADGSMLPQWRLAGLADI